MVELFTAWISQVAGMAIPVRPVTRTEAPHASQVERSQRLSIPLNGICFQRLR